MLPYFPFERDGYAMTMGVRALGERPVIEVDAERYREELALKAALLAASPRYYSQALPGSEPLQWEALEVVLPGMARQHPEHFALVEEGARWRWHNRLLGTEAHFLLEEGGLAHPPLDWLGRQVQEDVLLLDGTTPGWPLVAGQLCFASAWCLDDKLGRPLAEVHAPVPHLTETLGRSIDGLMARLEPGRPVVRVNWGIYPTPALNLAPITEPSWGHLRQGITPQDAGERLFLRLERQVLVRLPRTRAILFTIHTHRGPIRDEAADPLRRQRLAAVLRTLPPATRDYKRLTPFLAPLLAYLEEGEAALPSPAGRGTG